MKERLILNCGSCRKKVVLETETGVNLTGLACQLGWRFSDKNWHCPECATDIREWNRSRLFGVP